MYSVIESIVKADTPNPKNADDTLSRILDVIDSKEDYFLSAMTVFKDKDA